MATRRKFLKILGSSAVIVAAGAAGFAVTRTPARARAPWAAAGSAYTEPRRRALSYAILAPNPHNRQPWLVDLGQDGEIALYCDLDRLLPETDPFSRQITIGLGCFLEILRMAAAEDGYRAEIVPFPEGSDPRQLDARPVARIRLTPAPDIAKDPLFAQVLARRTIKEPYDTARPVAGGDLAALQATAGTGVATGSASDAATVEALRDLTWRAHQIEVLTPRTNMESVDLMRIGKTEIEANPDGIDIGGPMLEALNIAGILTRETLADQNSAGFRQGLDLYRQIMATAMAHLWITTAGDSRPEQLDAGASWVRVQLHATALGLCIHPLSQALQEYPEMAKLYDEIHAMLAPGRRIQMFARVGYGPSADPSPRWPLDARIRHA